jgi:hypothetical protein
MAAPVELNAAFMRIGFSQEASSAILADVNKEFLPLNPFSAWMTRVSRHSVHHCVNQVGQ